MLQDTSPTVNSELDQMNADLEAMRKEHKAESAEVADLGLGLSFEDWRELHSVSNEPGYYERNGEF